MCRCGCLAPVKKGATYASRACWYRFRKQQDALRPTCQTCPETLCAHDVAVGCKRCETCRAKQPGRSKASYAGQKRSLVRFAPQSKRTHQMGEGIAVSFKAFKKAKPAPSVSWWLEPEYQDRVKFQERARQLVPEPGASIVTSASGDCV